MFMLLDQLYTSYLIPKHIKVIFYIENLETIKFSIKQSPYVSEDTVKDIPSQGGCRPDVL